MFQSKTQIAMAQGQGEPGCLDPLWSPWEGHLDSPLPDMCAELPLGTGDGGSERR